jgi:hypothetical protein
MGIGKGKKEDTLVISFCRIGHIPSAIFFGCVSRAEDDGRMPRYLYFYISIIYPFSGLRKILLACGMLSR